MKKYKFKAKIEPGDGGGAYVLFPYDVEKELGTKGKIAVKATFDGVPYRGSLIKYGQPQHILPILKAIREEIRKGLGDTIDVELWKDEEARTIAVPPEFEEAMRGNGVDEFFEALSYTHRKEYCRWVTEAKKEETRQRRLGKAIEMLKQGCALRDKHGENAMNLSKPARLMCGITLLIVPTIMYGGWTLLGVLMHGRVGGQVNGLQLNPTQWALWRAGHAHAGVWTLLSLVIQILLDSARLPTGLVWVARISAPVSAVALSGAFFGLAFSAAFSPLLYLGIGLMLFALVATGIGLLRGSRTAG
jgi:Bacteriocin-protection, YdeI or OmpD-Associated/Domain of unknown function (DUF1905)